MSAFRITKGDIILAAAEQHAYFRSLYTKLLENYGARTFAVSPVNLITQQEIKDLLRYADLFSKSNVTNKISFHRNLAQEIVIMLSFVFEDNEEAKLHISAVQKIVLKNASNYAGLEKVDMGGAELSEDFLSLLSEEVDKMINKVPNNETEYFSDAQKEAFRNLCNMQFYSFSAPTSMGKTYIIRNFLSQKLEEVETDCIVMVLPTKALINEIENDLTDKYERELKGNNYVIITIPDQIHFFRSQKKILIFTPERLLQAFNDGIVPKIDYLFIDEAQKIFENDSRTPYYYKILEKVNTEMRLAKVFFSSPYAKNPEELLNLISNPYKENRQEIARSDAFDFSPVSQKQFIIDSLTGNIEIYNNLEKTIISIACIKKDWKDIVCEQTKRGATIVYCKSKADAVEYARQYAENLLDKPSDSDVDELIKKIKSDVNADYYLIPLLKKGVAFHMGIMPAEIRRSVEDLIKNGKIDIVFCTSTLLEGVNLPAVNVFVLSHKKGTSTLSTLELKNLMGRAGRIRYNLWGNAFLLNICSQDSVGEYHKHFSQILSSNKLLPEVDGRKREIVTSLFNRNFVFNKKKSESYDDLAKFVMYRNVLAIALKSSDKNSPIYKHYAALIEKEQLSKELIEIDSADILDIRFAPEIVNKIKEEISTDKISLPKIVHIEDIVDDEPSERVKQAIESNSAEIFDFYIKLYDVFSWDVFERKDQIGNVEKKTESLSHYARLTSRWIAGQRLSKIIFGRMFGYEKNGEYWDKYERVKKPYRKDSDVAKNYVIMEVMDEIENELKFSLSNYITKFVKLYRGLKTDVPENTIADYIDYGTMNDIIIIFQKMGVNREVAKEIYTNSLYEVNSEGKYVITDFSKLQEITKHKDEMERIEKNLRNIIKADPAEEGDI